MAALFSEHGDFVFRTLQYLGVAPAALDDGLQDVFVTAHRRWESFEGRSSPRTWLYGIARRVAFRYRRKDHNRRQRFVLTERPVDGVDAPFEQANARRSVQRLLEGLDEDKRAAFVLVEVEGFTASEAAELLEVPLGTVYSRVRAAWGRLREAAQDDLGKDAMASVRPQLESRRREAVQRAVLAACLPVGTATVAKASAGGGTVAWLWGLAGAGVVAVGISAAVALAPSPSSPPPPEASPQDSPVPAARPVEASPTPSLPATPRPEAVPPQAEPHDEAPAAKVPSPPKPRPRAEPKPEPAKNTLAAELTLIRRAKELARDGKPEDAAKVLDEHARRFPAGQLVDEREEVRKSLE